MNEFIQDKACDNCPFNESGPGRVLRDSFRAGRFESIKAELEEGKVFNCHKTTPQTGDGSNKICAGALGYQRANNCVPDGVQAAERLSAMTENRKARW